MSLAVDSNSGGALLSSVMCLQKKERKLISCFFIFSTNSTVKSYNHLCHHYNIKLNLPECISSWRWTKSSNKQFETLSNKFVWNQNSVDQLSKGKCFRISVFYLGLLYKWCVCVFWTLLCSIASINTSIIQYVISHWR